MPFALPVYQAPDFADPALASAPLTAFKQVTRPGVPPEDYHATSIFPEYFHLAQGHWVLPRCARMDCVVVRDGQGALAVKEFRRLNVGEAVACGRSENGEEGIYVHSRGFRFGGGVGDKFAFRSQFTRETAFSIDYDELYELLNHERHHGFVAWVLGPAVVFDRDARQAFVQLVAEGYVHALLAGNALAVHDLEGALFGTALGQDIYTKALTPGGHYRHLDTIAAVRGHGSIRAAIEAGRIQDGIMHAVHRQGIPFVLAGSIRDDGPLPEVLADVYRAQDAMRAVTDRATTIVALATQLHAIATGNMVPSYRMQDDGTLRPVYFYTVDMSEFAVNKLANRGSLTAHSILTNVQDFVVTVQRGLRQQRAE